MNHCVPTFEMDDDHSIPASSNLSRSKKSFMAEEEIMELLWQNGQVVAQSQNQRKSSPNSKYDTVIPAELELRPSSSQPQLTHQHEQQHHLFMQEDEMASWLHYPLVDEDPSLDHNFSADLLYPAPTITTTTTNNSPPPPPPPAVAAEALRPPVPPAWAAEPEFSARQRARVGAEAGPPCVSKSVVATTVVDSCDTPAVGGPYSRVSEAGRRSSGEASYGGGGPMAANEAMMASSPGDSSASAEPPPPPARFPAEDRKRKGIEPDDAECHSEDIEFESGDAKKHAHGTTSAKRSRAAEVHNLSERRRRDRINEKMKALQELIPRCNKSDKASMLDEAIEYLKSLQMQVQMMSMGCGMVPMMFPGMQQYMPPMGMGMGMGIGMGMGMGMEMGMNRPMIPFPNMLTGSAMPQPATAAHLGPRFPMPPPVHMPPVPPTTEPSRAQPTNQPNHMFQSFSAQNPNQPRVPNFSDPYQPYLGSHQMMLPVLQQNPGMVQPSTSKSSTTSRGPENPENRQSG